MQSVLVGIPKIHLSVRSLSSFWERPTFSSVLSIRPLSFCSLDNGTCLLKYYRHTHTDSRRDCDRLWLWGVYEYKGSSFVSILYHFRAFSNPERPCYSLSIWCKSDKKRDVTSLLWLDRHFLFLTGKDEGTWCKHIFYWLITNTIQNITMTIAINFITVINQWDPKTSNNNLCKFVSQDESS